MLVRGSITRWAVGGSWGAWLRSHRGVRMLPRATEAEAMAPEDQSRTCCCRRRRLDRWTMSHAAMVVWLVLGICCRQVISSRYPSECLSCPSLHRHVINTYRRPPHAFLIGPALLLKHNWAKSSPKPAPAVLPTTTHRHAHTPARTVQRQYRRPSVAPGARLVRSIDYLYTAPPPTTTTVNITVTPPPPRAGPVPSTPITPRALDYIRITVNGTTTPGKILKNDLASLLGCPVRDLRLIDTSFPHTCGGAFLARSSGVILCVERVRAVLRSNEVMLFDPLSKDVQALLPALQSQLVSGHNATLESPFEHVVLEAILSHACQRVQDKLQAVAPQIFKILGDLKFRPGTLTSFTRSLDELLPLRNRLSELHSRVEEMRKAMNEVLMSDEDMAAMYLTSRVETGVGRRVDQHREVEMLFENYLMQVEWSESEIHEIQQAIKNTEDTVEIQLDLLRNRILRFELLMNIIQTIMGAGALVSGIFGMNLLSGIENNPKAFWRVTVGLCGAMMAMFGSAKWYGRKAKVL